LLSCGKDPGEKFSFAPLESQVDLGDVTEKSYAVRAVEWRGLHDESLELEVGEESIDYKWADII
tara:strand:+ start:1133 stop:1324 length:192 start_codon:yes stop_codon:yes gene_type:complete